MTDAERRLWSRLRRDQLDVRFRRQVPFGPYILDFFSVKIKLNIEADGSQHYENQGMKKDKRRNKYLKENGITVLRFSDREILQNIDGVMQAIYENVQRKLQG